MLSVVSAPTLAFGAGVARVVPQRAAVQMSAGPMYDEPLAPSGMGREFINKERAPLSSYVGASQELAAFPGGGGKEGMAPTPWDPFCFSELYKVSANNPDVAWLREAELKHGRMAMLAITGVMVQSTGFHLPGNAEVSFANSDWVSAPTTLPPVVWGQVLAFVAIAEGQTSEGLFDLWLGDTSKREPGNLGWGSGLLSKDKKAADKMRLKELKNGRLAMLAIMGVAANHFIPGALPGCIYS